MAFVRDLKSRPGGDIYLSGGGAFSGAVLAARIILKFNPAIAGTGVPLCADALPPKLSIVEVERYVPGVLPLTYDVGTAC